MLNPTSIHLTPSSLGILSFFVAIFLPPLLSAQIHPDLQFDEVYSGFSSPIYITNAGDGSNRLFVVERAGSIKIIENGITLPTDFLDINTKVSTTSERGLLGLAFHPEYQDSGYFYLHYSNTSGHSQIARFKRKATDPNQADALSEESILLINQPAGNHNGGTVEFGPDGYLYIGMGDGGNTPQYAQDPDRLLGKMLRIDIDHKDPGLEYAIPPTNPFVGVSTRDEIWTFGLRNPFRWSFDRLTGDMWIGDVGQTDWEEVNFQPASSTGGENYGWRCYEGNSIEDTSGCLPIANYDFPVYEYANGAGPYSITGGRVYRGANVCLQGVYICADSRNNTAYTVVPNGMGWSGQVQALGIGSIVGFGEDETGELYAVSLTTGKVYKVNGKSNLLLQNPIPTGTYMADGLLQSAGAIESPSIVNFLAGESIDFLPNFEVQKGSVLSGMIGCSGS